MQLLTCSCKLPRCPNSSLLPSSPKLHLPTLYCKMQNNCMACSQTLLTSIAQQILPVQHSNTPGEYSKNVYPASMVLLSTLHIPPIHSHFAHAEPGYESGEHSRVDFVSHIWVWHIWSMSEWAGVYFCTQDFTASRQRVTENWGRKLFTIFTVSPYWEADMGMVFQTGGEKYVMFNDIWKLKINTSLLKCYYFNVS